MDSLPVGDKMENFIIAFDVDGTLISNINENVIQERRVHGQEYAQQWVERLQLEKYVWRVYSKGEYEKLRSLHKVIAIDDIQRTRLGNVANLIVRMK